MRDRLGRGGLGGRFVESRREVDGLAHEIKLSRLSHINLSTTSRVPQPVVPGSPRQRSGLEAVWRCNNWSCCNEQQCNIASLKLANRIPSYQG